MAMSVNPTIEGNLLFVMGHYDPAAMIRPRSTDPIRASGHAVPHPKAEHMTAAGRTSTARKKPLPSGGHPHMTNYPHFQLVSSNLMIAAWWLLPAQKVGGVVELSMKTRRILV